MAPSISSEPEFLTIRPTVVLVNLRIAWNQRAEKGQVTTQQDNCARRIPLREKSLFGATAVSLDQKARELASRRMLAGVSRVSLYRTDIKFCTGMTQRG